MAKARKVVVTLELETDAPLEALSAASFWDEDENDVHNKVTRLIPDADSDVFTVHQAGVMVIREIKDQPTSDGK